MLEEDKDKFCKEANDFLYKRGYIKSEPYFVNTHREDDIIFFYYKEIFNNKHPNGKTFKSWDESNRYKYIDWIVELIKPIMSKNK